MLEQEARTVKKDKYALKYTLQTALLLFIPLAMPTLAVYQELRKRSHQ
jgi:hypothetical protein